MLHVALAHVDVRTRRREGCSRDGEDGEDHLHVPATSAARHERRTTPGERDERAAARRVADEEEQEQHRRGEEEHEELRTEEPELLRHGDRLNSVAARSISMMSRTAPGTRNSRYVSVYSVLRRTPTRVFSSDSTSR